MKDFSIDRIKLPDPKVPITTFKVAAPRQWYHFIEKYPDQAPTGPLSYIPLNEDSLYFIRMFNREVNAFGFRSDRGRDSWDVVKRLFIDGIPEKGFDCDDIALTKRHFLRNIDIDINAMNPIVCKTVQGWHLVLGVNTDLGMFILDNLHIEPIPWSSLPYTWAEMLMGTDGWRLMQA